MSESRLVAWYCRRCKKRVEAPVDEKRHTECNHQMRRCSRYEWFFSDALIKAVARHPKLLDQTVRFWEQYPIEDHRGFFWYVDVAVEVRSADWHSAGFLIEINGTDHARQAVYDGKQVSGITRDDDKHWEIFSNHKMHKSGWDMVTLTNDECRKAVADTTAANVLNRLLDRCYWIKDHH